MLKVNTFLGCIKLETGGLIIGWLNAICSFFGSLGVAAMLVLESIYDCDDLSKILNDNHKFDFEFDVCRFERPRPIGILIASLELKLLIGIFIISCFFLKGLNRKDHIYVMPCMVLMALTAIYRFLNIFLESSYSSIGAAIGTAFSVYAFIITYSIYKKFKNDFDAAPPVDYLATIEKV